MAGCNLVIVKQIREQTRRLIVKRMSKPENWGNFFMREQTTTLTIDHTKTLRTIILVSKFW